MFDTILSRARIAALSGDFTKAKQCLRGAIERGWKGQDTDHPNPDPEADPAFEALRDKTDFKAIIAELRASQRREAGRLARVNLSGLF